MLAVESDVDELRGLVNELRSSMADGVFDAEMRTVNRRLDTIGLHWMRRCLNVRTCGRMAKAEHDVPVRAETTMKTHLPPARSHGSRRPVRRAALVAALTVLLPVAASACSSDETSEGAKPTPASSALPTNSDTADDGTTAAPVETSATAETASSGGATTGEATTGEGGCSTVPSKEVVESIIGSTVLPVEDQGTVGCAYLGDGDNVGVYFEIETDEFEIESFDNPDPQFATMVDDPALPPGSFVQSGDFYAKKNDVLYKVVAGVTGTEDDNQLATELMIAWLTLIPS